VALKSNLLLAKAKGGFAVIEWNIVDGVTGAEVFRRKQGYTRGVADDGSSLAGESAGSFQTRILVTETAVRDAKLAALVPATDFADVEKTGADQSVQFAGLAQ
jgi:hypothetical protein